jgi:hypothetical protein
VPYSHVTFTLLHQLSLLALQNPRRVYNILFQAVSETLLTLAADPRRIGAQMGDPKFVFTRTLSRPGTPE